MFQNLGIHLRMYPAMMLQKVLQNQVSPVRMLAMVQNPLMNLQLLLQLMNRSPYQNLQETLQHHRVQAWTTTLTSGMTGHP